MQGQGPSSHSGLMLPNGAVAVHAQNCVSETPVVTPMNVATTTWRTLVCPSNPVRPDAPLRLDAATPRMLWPDSGASTPLTQPSPGCSGVALPIHTRFFSNFDETPAATPISTPCNAATTTWRTLRCPNAPAHLHHKTFLHSGRSTPSSDGILTPMVRLWPNSVSSTPCAERGYPISSNSATPTASITLVDMSGRRASAPSLNSFGMEYDAPEFQAKLEHALADISNEPLTPTARRPGIKEESPGSSSPKPLPYVRSVSIVGMKENLPAKIHSAGIHSMPVNGFRSRLFTADGVSSMRLATVEESTCQKMSARHRSHTDPLGPAI